MNAESTVLQFAATLAEKRTYEESFYARGQELQAEFTAKLKTAWKKACGRKRFDSAKAAKLLPDYEAIRAPFQAKADEMIAERGGRVKALDSALDQLAERATLPLTAELQRIDSVHVESYRSQGYGAEKYASGDAESIADKARFYGLNVEVRRVATEYQSSFTGKPFFLVAFEVWANTNETGAEILRRKAGPPLRDVLAAYWKRGVNPRVIYPFLPWNLEEKLGVDYFGNFVEPRPNMKLSPR
jgi:hypothetical protein